MDVLEGKLKELFLEYCHQTEGFMQTYDLIYLYPLIIEFLDRHGIFICVTPVMQGDELRSFMFSIASTSEIISNEREEFKSRIKATKGAIEKSVEIFNKRHEDQKNTNPDYPKNR